MSIYVRDAAGNRQKFAGVGLPGPPGADGKSAYQYAVDGGFTGTEAEFAALMGVRSNKNLLDNWYFLDPINQQGKEAYTADYSGAYCIDRWVVVNGNIQITECGIVFDHVDGVPAAISQKMETRLDKEIITFSVLTPSSLYWINASFPEVSTVNTYNEVDVTIDSIPFTLVLWTLADGSGCELDLITRSGKSCVFCAAKLELGPTQTLARKDADGSWVLNDPPPDKALELAKCQRYQIDNVEGYRSWKNGNNQSFLITTPVTLRAKPTISGTLYGAIEGNNNLVQIPDSEVRSIVLYSNGVYVLINSGNLYEKIVLPDASGLDSNL